MNSALAQASSSFGSLDMMIGFLLNCHPHDVFSGIHLDVSCLNPLDLWGLIPDLTLN